MALALRRDSRRADHAAYLSAPPNDQINVVCRPRDPGYVGCSAVEARARCDRWVMSRTRTLQTPHRDQPLSDAPAACWSHTFWPATPGPLLPLPACRVLSRLRQRQSPTARPPVGSPDATAADLAKL